MESLVVHRIRPGDGPLLREVRLRALSTDPDAFGSTYSAEVGRTDEDWEMRATRASEGDTQFIALAVAGDSAVGMAGGYQPEEAPLSRGLYGMWVAPEARSSGVGFDLVEVTVDWARAAGSESIHLSVVTTNTAALTLYRKAGFTETGETQPLPSNPDLLEVEMSLRFI